MGALREPIKVLWSLLGNKKNYFGRKYKDRLKLKIKTKRSLYLRPEPYYGRPYHVCTSYVRFVNGFISWWGQNNNKSRPVI